MANRPEAAGDLAACTATEIARLVGAREASPVEVAQAALDRIDTVNDPINAVVTINEHLLDEARSLEKTLSAGGVPGPLCGVPVGIKDVTPVAGIRTTYGSPLFANHIPDEDALVVERLKAAGALIVGKTNTPEFAAGANTYNKVFGRTRNPWNRELSAGGSTGGGAAALASGMIAIAEGTDLGGSLRIPASFCGLVGIRPSSGLVPAWPTNWLWDDLSVTGPIARNAEDAALALSVMSGQDPRLPMCQSTVGKDFVGDTASLQLDGLRLAYSHDVAGIGVDKEIEECCQNSALGLIDGGATVDPMDVDLSEGRKAFLHLRGLWFVSHMHDHLDQLSEMGENVRGNVEAGLKLTTEQLAWANAARGRMWSFFEEFFRRYDFLLTPTTAISPFPVTQNHPDKVGGQQMKTYIDWFAPTFLLSLTGLPVASVPCGLDPEGLPVGLQVVGPPGGEGRVLGLCARIQEAHPIGGPDLDALVSSP